MQEIFTRKSIKVLDCGIADGRVVALPKKSGRRYVMKIERYLPLALAFAVLLIIGTFFYDHRELLK
jgi:hypothetical protein